MGHDLKGGNSYFRCGVPGLNVALQALIDYKGSVILRNVLNIFLSVPIQLML